MAGFVAYEGSSRIDGSPIVCIVTGIGNRKSDRSRNAKTGEMAQVWYLLRDVSPMAAINSGEDSGICGSCPLRGIIEKQQDGSGRNRMRSCYVDVSNAPRAIWEAYQAGKYDPLPADYTWKDQATRLGAYGDPVVVPVRINRDLIRRGNGSHTGYSHQWRKSKFQSSRSLLMASVESAEDAAEAQRRGWRTFRTMSADSALTGSEILCPASAEAGNVRTCETCRACNGSSSAPGENPLQRSIAIFAHGSPSRLGSYARMIGSSQ